MKTLSKSKLKAMRTELTQWLALDVFSQRTDCFMDRLPTSTLFNACGLTFLREAWVAARFSQTIRCEAVQLCRESRPDFRTRCGETVKAFEVAEVLESGRKRGEETKQDTADKHESLAEWQSRAAQIPAAVQAIVRKKVMKNYPPDVCLLLYLNIDELGIRQTEIETSMHSATEVAKDKFQEVWILWKTRFYLLSADGVASTCVLSIPSEYRGWS